MVNTKGCKKQKESNSEIDIKEIYCLIEDRG